MYAIFADLPRCGKSTGISKLVAEMVQTLNPYVNYLHVNQHLASITVMPGLHPNIKIARPPNPLVNQANRARTPVTARRPDLFV